MVGAIVERPINIKTLLIALKILSRSRFYLYCYVRLGKPFLVRLAFFAIIGHAIADNKTLLRLQHMPESIAKQRFTWFRYRDTEFFNQQSSNASQKVRMLNGLPDSSALLFDGFNRVCVAKSVNLKNGLTCNISNNSRSIDIFTSFLAKKHA